MGTAKEPEDLDMGAAKEPDGIATPGLIEPEAADAASTDPKQDNARGEHVVSSSGAPQGITDPSEAAPEPGEASGARAPE